MSSFFLHLGAWSLFGMALSPIWYLPLGLCSSHPTAFVHDYFVVVATLGVVGLMSIFMHCICEAL